MAGGSPTEVPPHWEPKMFEHHFGLRENPFPAGHQLKFVYPSREHQEARAHLRYGIENREPFLLITGEVGTGKTTSLYDALNEWGDRVAVALITNSSLTRQEMLEEICLRFGLSVAPGTSKPALMVALERHLISVRAKGEHAVLMMDEAQNLSMDLLEEIRLLSNLENRGDKLLQIFLVGQPELEAHLARHELRQLRQRITVHYRLNPLSPDETLGYIHHHINVAGGSGAQVFPTDTCREIYRLTHGIPREINTLASSALIAAYADNSESVSMEHVITVAREGDFKSVLSGPATRPTEPVAAPPRPVAMPTPPPPPTPTPRPQIVPTQPPTQPWPAMPQMHTEPVAPPAPPAYEPPAPAVSPPVSPYAPAASSAPPAPPEPQRPVHRERGEFTKGVVAAMRRSEPVSPPAPPAPPAPPMKRHTFATPPPPAPLPLPLPNLNDTEREKPALVPPAPTPIATPRAPDDFSGLPPRLRERLEKELSRDDSGAPPMRNLLIVVSVIATLGIVLLLMQRFGAIDVPLLRGAAGTHANRTAADGPEGLLTPPESVKPEAATSADPTTALIDSLRREVETAKTAAKLETASTTSIAVQPTRPRPAPVHASTPSTTGAAATGAAASGAAATGAKSTTAGSAPAGSTPASTAAYGVGVASYLDEDRANVERDRFAADTALPAAVMAYNDAGTIMYRVVLGRWASSNEAERNANSLMERGLINEARVLQLPKK